MVLRTVIGLSLVLGLTLNCLSPAQCDEGDSSSAVPPAERLKQISALSVPDLLRGSVEKSVWQKYYDSGMKALEHRLYVPAEKKLTAAIAELRKHGRDDITMLSSRLAFGQALDAEDRHVEAERIFNDCLLRARCLTGANSLETAAAAQGLALALVHQGRFDRSEPLCRKALAIRQALLPSNHHDTAESLKGLALSLAGQGLEEEALPLYRKAISILETAPGYEQMDLADALYDLGLTLHSLGRNAESTSLLAQCFAIRDRATRFDLSAAHKGPVKVRWEDGNPRARQVFDPEYPLKYSTAAGLRVATTIVRSENLLVAIISLANCSKSRIELGVGPVLLEQLAPHAKPFKYIDPATLDIPLEELHITALTWRRRWLNHIEKTRRIPGYLQAGVLDPDNFFGNNIFGPYGHWEALARTATPVVTREQFLYGKDESAPSYDSADFLSTSSIEMLPTFIDPGDSRTGFVYFQRERFDKARLKVIVGNVLMEFPFDSAGPR